LQKTQSLYQSFTLIELPCARFEWIYKPLARRT
jgi:hypothetical protein